MKIRSGFVSNSSSCSFYIQQPKEHLPFESISEYFGINPDLSEEERVWLTLCIWQVLKEQESFEKSVRENDSEESDYLDHRRSESVEYYLSDSNIEWMQSVDYYRRDSEYWEEAKKILEDPQRVLFFDLDDNGSEDFFENSDFKVPWSVAYDLRRDADKAFTKPSKAIGISE